MEKTHITPNQIINQLLCIGHGDLSGYTATGLLAARHEAELLGRMISWNRTRGKIRDTKVALPVLALRGPADEELFENAAAHLCTLSPRDLLRAASYHRQLGGVTPGGGRWLKTAVHRYIREREAKRGWWDRTVLQHRRSMKSLYAQFHILPSDRAQAVLFDNKRPAGSVFEAVAQLPTMGAKEAAGTILHHRIPFLIAVGALQGIKDKPDTLLALIESMSGSELINNTAMLKRFGVMENPVLRAAYDAGLERAKADKRVSTLKATRAAEAVGDKKAKAKLQGVQEAKLAQTGGIDGDWLVMGDKSGSMHTAIEVSRQVSALLAQQVKGQIHLVFFDTRPYYHDVTGKSYEDIQAITKRVTASGMTCGGCGLDIMLAKGHTVNGIAICGDGGENVSPYFVDVYRKYVDRMGVEPTVYMFYVPVQQNVTEQMCRREGIPIEVFNVGTRPDYYALPELVNVLRASKYALHDEIMQTPLLTMNEVFAKTKGE